MHLQPGYAAMPIAAGRGQLTLCWGIIGFTRNFVNIFRPFFKRFFKPFNFFCFFYNFFQPFQTFIAFSNFFCKLFWNFDIFVSYVLLWSAAMFTATLQRFMKMKFRLFQQKFVRHCDKYEIQMLRKNISKYRKQHSHFDMIGHLVFKQAVLTYL